MSWFVLGIFVLLVTWGFTKSIVLGIVLLFTCCALYSGFALLKNRSRRLVKPSRAQRYSRQEFLTTELKRLKDLRESGLLTDDELTVQNRLLSCSDRSNTYKTNCSI
ncbi:hypothetical protein [Sporosarcina sp. A2]|uniref:hypothetical protein n=1 Tax=Sporosarcina sp. A2 TaxID=3393449 RepID=UPI003D7950C1